MIKYHTLRLILGDQLNEAHSWYNKVDKGILYVLMEIRPESEYVTHHIQKIVGIFAAMRAFADKLEEQGHQVCYYRINDAKNLHSFEANCNHLIAKYESARFEYQAPDEYRLDEVLKTYVASLTIKSQMWDTEHFYTTREELAQLAKGKKKLIMETFYRYMRKKHEVLMDGGKPVGGKWNYDHANRKKLPRQHVPPQPFRSQNVIDETYQDIKLSELNYIGKLSTDSFVWTITREQGIEALEDFVIRLLPNFGCYQDAMHEDYWSIYHSRLSFALNIKLISPKEVVNRVIGAYEDNPSIDIAQTEGFVRQIIGWREYMRGIYWMEMPAYYTDSNYLEAERKLPAYFWNGQTKMNCMQKAIGQSLRFAYAHHIQRLMVTGNFCLLTGIRPSEVDEWYLGIYIDAFEWVELTNTRGMSQFADGGIIATKPYCSSANYIDKMSNYCCNCHYDKKIKVGPKACPFNSLYWNFIAEHEAKLAQNPRMSMMYRLWHKMDEEVQKSIREQANQYLEKIEEL